MTFGEIHPAGRFGSATTICMSDCRSLILLLSLVSSGPPGPDGSAPGPGGSAGTEVDVDEFIGSYWADHASIASPGLAYAFVRDGQPEAVGGRGRVSIDETVAVDRDTVFRLASISKVFVALSALILVDQGRLDLDRPVRSYVPDVPIRNRFDKAVTLRHLLLHTAGFDERFFGDMTSVAALQEPLGAHLARRLPPVVRAPGTMMVYSNYGYALAGYVVERVAGMPFARFARTHVFEPLGMRSTSFELSADLRRRMAVGHRRRAESFVTEPYTYVHRYPATSALSTAADMSRFVRAMVNDTCLEGRCLLTEATRPLVYERQTTNHPLLPGRTLVFMEWARNGVPGLWHDGGHVGFLADLVIFPSNRSGLFVAVNEKTTGFSGQLKRALLDRLYPFEGGAPASAAPIDPTPFAGRYVFSRRAEADFEKVAQLVRPSVALTVDSEGGLQFKGLRLIPVSAGYFVEEDVGRLQMAFTPIGTGGMRMYVDWGGAPKALDRVSGFASRDLHRALFVGLPLLDLALAGLLLARARRWGRWRMVWAAMYGGLALFFVAMIIAMATTTSTEFRFGRTLGLPELLYLPWGLLWAFAVCAACSAYLRPPRGLHWALLAFVALQLLFLRYWGFLGTLVG